MKFFKGRVLAAYLLAITLMVTSTGCVPKEVAEQDKKTAVSQAKAAAAIKHQQDITRVYASKDDEIKGLRADLQQRDEQIRQLETNRQRDLQKKYDEGVAAGTQIGEAKGFQAGQDSGQDVAQQVFDEKLKAVEAQHETAKRELVALAKERQAEAIETAVGQAKLLWASQSMVENNRFTLLICLVAGAFTIVVSLLGATSLFAYRSRGQAEDRREFERKTTEIVEGRVRQREEARDRDRRDEIVLGGQLLEFGTKGLLQAEKNGLDTAPHKDTIRLGLLKLGNGGTA